MYLFQRKNPFCVNWPKLYFFQTVLKNIKYDFVKDSYVLYVSGTHITYIIFL